MHAKSCVKFKAQELQVPPVAHIIIGVHSGTNEDSDHWAHSNNNPQSGVFRSIPVEALISTQRSAHINILIVYVWYLINIIRICRPRTPMTVK